ncbi:Retrotransposon-derived protein PEG10 [Merluccius polli]|uniref:Retrotransposon-derived protein PEG10 n=1 Tax=Merluccius polli TaxID=89951 RepID=A0AA47M6N9_MERPO|nr:Retrotransposon-derived protein PEG10 [Merluccius polli]
MDPAHNPDPLARLDRVETQLQHQEAMLASITAFAQSLSLPAPPSHPPSFSSPSSSISWSRPRGSSGSSGTQKGTQKVPYTFATEEFKVAFTINNLTGHARLWGTAEWERHTPACSSFNAFTTELCKGSCSVTDYAIDFRIRTRRSELNQAAQVDTFLLGLADYIKDELVSHDLPASLDENIALASHGFKPDTMRDGRDKKNGFRLLVFQLFPGH